MHWDASEVPFRSGSLPILYAAVRSSNSSTRKKSLQVPNCSEIPNSPNFHSTVRRSMISKGHAFHLQVHVSMKFFIW